MAESLPDPRPPSLTAQIRKAVAEKMGATPCPTCGRSGSMASLRVTAKASGVGFSTIGRFLQGGSVSSDNLDRLAAWTGA